MKKLISILLTMAMMIGVITAMPAMPASAANVEDLLSLELSNGTVLHFEFVDIAHDGDTYVALAKPNSDWGYSRILYSHDGGMTWATAKTRYSGPLSVNPRSQQQLVYWPEQKAFVLHSIINTAGVNNSCMSKDGGVTWEENANISWTTNAYFTISGKYLLAAGGSADTAFCVKDNTTATDWGNSKVTFVSSANKSTAVASKPVGDDGVIHAFSVGGNQAAYYKTTTPVTKGEKPTGTWEKIYTAGNAAIPARVYDTVYAKGGDEFLSVTEEGFLYSVSANEAEATPVFNKFEINSGSLISLGSTATAVSGIKVTGINANDDYIVIGTSDGKMYYTSNDAAISEETILYEIEPNAGAAVANEEIRNIEFSDDTNFVALGQTHVYKGSIGGYENINEYFGIEAPKLDAKTVTNMFDGVRLIGGAYSETLDKYIVYGDTTAPDEDGKYWGKIFTSADGFNWENTYTGYTFSLRNENATTGAVSYTEVRNGAVWWESQGQFIVSASTKDHAGYSLTSTDGETWTGVKGVRGENGEEGEVYTGLALNVDLRVSGDALYTSKGRDIIKYTAWNEENSEIFANIDTLENIPANLKDINQIAVSDDADPAILGAAGYLGAVRNNDSEAAEEIGKWSVVRTFINADNPNVLGIGNGDVTDAVYSKNLGKFVAVVMRNLRTVIIPKEITADDKAIQGPVVAGGVVVNAIDTNDSVFMLAGADFVANGASGSAVGKIYTAPDSEEFKNGYSLANNAVLAATEDDEVTWNMTNVFKTKGDRFIVTSSNNTDSAVLVVDKNNNDKYEYKRAGLTISRLEGFEPGDKLTINANYTNKRSEDKEFIIIAAFYNGDTLTDVQTRRETAAAGTSDKVSETITVSDKVDENTEMRIFIWNSLDDMVPLTDPVNPFETENAADPT